MLSGPMIFRPVNGATVTYGLDSTIHCPDGVRQPVRDAPRGFGELPFGYERDDSGGSLNFRWRF